MKTQASDFHETFAHLRDGRRQKLAEALERAVRRETQLREALEGLDKPEPPSKAHRARIGRAGAGKVAAPRAYPPLSELHALKLRQLEQLKRDKAELGGSMTVAPARGSTNDSGFRWI